MCLYDRLQCLDLLYVLVSSGQLHMDCIWSRWAFNLQGSIVFSWALMTLDRTIRPGLECGETCSNNSSWSPACPMSSEGCMTSRHTRSNAQEPLFTLSNEELARLERQNRQQPRPTNNTMVDHGGQDDLTAAMALMQQQMQQMTQTINA
ncbi:hypothetical protein DY000_02040250 [Brassica cretica]|uniref:Uncharacterized protein n=1 Tax=Brassica cretica TaxID=69181 RepID=A0ABQ7BP61_BRACR|nr:hypothetical protein DY000_02040250 [Brassica cretica]